MLFDEHLTLAKSGHVLPASLSPIIVVNYRGLILVSRAEMRAAQGRSNQGSKPEPPTDDPRRGRNATTLYLVPHCPKAHILIIFGHQHRRNADSNLRGKLISWIQKKPFASVCELFRAFPVQTQVDESQKMSLHLWCPRNTHPRRLEQRRLHLLRFLRHSWV